MPKIRTFLLRLTAYCLPLTVLLLTAYGSTHTASDYTRWVDPFIGTGGHGHTFPGATTPFGMVQLSPDTRIDNWDGSSGYHYSDDVIYGFSHTHLSGTGIPDYCDILVAPYVHEKFLLAQAPENTKIGYASKFSHASETAEPGYYAVRLDDENIYAEMTSTPRVGLHRYTFPEATKDAKIAIDLKWRDPVLESRVNIVNDRRIEGMRRSSSWAKDQVVYFVAEFSKPFVEKRTARFEGDRVFSYNDKNELQTKDGAGAKAFFRFEVEEKEQILVRVALSPVSIEGARKNLEAELDHWDFEKVRSDAKDSWNRELSKIEVKGGTDAQMTNFYTALYHTMIQPNIFQDVDGTYRGMDWKIRTLKSESFQVPGSRFQVRKIDANINGRDSSNQTRNLELGTRNSSARVDAHYTVFSLWDTFRATHPLYTIIDEKRTVEFINTFIRQYEQGGKLPVWELAGNETDTMIGYNAVSVIADAMAKGIEGFDYDKAYEAAKHSSELDIEGLDAFRRRGYISMEDEQESVARTLEYAYNSYCLAVMAAMMEERGGGKEKSAGFDTDFRQHIYRAQYYKNLFDKQTGFMRPKQNGNWISPFAPNEVTFHFTEANSWQYTFFVPHDVNGLIDLYGGKKPFAGKLDGLFTADSKTIGRDQPDITGLIGQYAHGNEPSHHIAYLYNFADQPWKTQFYVRKIMDEFYKPEPDGLIGNEDCGQMSAWYVLSALGFYQVNPSVPEYSIGTPLFQEAKINLENGRIFTISRTGEGQYVKSLKLNGKSHRESSFLHKNIMKGGALEFEMTGEAVKGWFRSSPTSQISNEFPVVPTIEASRVFENKTEVRISKPLTGNVYYTLEGTEPTEKSTLYKGPFEIDRTTVVKAVNITNPASKSLTAESKLNKMPHDWDVSLKSSYSRQYTGGGPKGLVDGLRGTTNFASGEWQGYQGQDFEAVIDLQRETEIKKLGAGFLQVARSWIWMPTKVEFETSLDGTTYAQAAAIETNFPEREMEHTIRDYVKEISPVRARYIRVRATNLGVIPDWHPGAGYAAYIFIDEIFVN
ncbi:MAG: GH92 family glycosyl hydrolase [Acidobacteriota bacterium]|nr:GH92 family glycosyl hydrolase [Acidobacteriota bacterium]